MTHCSWGELRVLAAVGVSRGTRNPMADNDSWSPKGASKGVFLPLHPVGDSLSPNLTDINSWWFSGGEKKPLNVRQRLLTSTCPRSSSQAAGAQLLSMTLLHTSSGLVSQQPF